MAEVVTEKLLLTASEAAQLCNRGRSTWLRLLKRGLIPKPRRLGGGVLWSRAELVKWIENGCPNRLDWEMMTICKKV
jgi:excisionase family DNA binding protein